MSRPCEMATPILELSTERLRIWVPGREDAPAILRYYEENRTHLEAWEPTRSETFYTHQYWQKRLDACLADAEEGHSLRYFLELHTERSRPVVGSINFTNVVDGAFHACHLGFSVAAAFEGQGLMHEGIEAALPAAFKSLQLHRVMANYQPHNQRSGRLLERLGFEREGYAKDYLRIDGSWRDHVLTALTNTDWRA